MRGDRQGAKVKVLNRKGIANQTGPESCVPHREVRDEALTREPAGQPLSRENTPKIRVPTLSLYADGNTDWRDSASACSALRGLRSWHVGTLFAREPGDLLLGRSSCDGAVHVGRRGVEADEERAGEVRPLQSSEAAGEQTESRRGRSLGLRGGVGGAKGWPRGTRESNTRAGYRAGKACPGA